MRHHQNKSDRTWSNRTLAALAMMAALTLAGAPGCEKENPPAPAPTTAPAAANDQGGDANILPLPDNSPPNDILAPALATAPPVPATSPAPTEEIARPSAWIEPGRREAFEKPDIEVTDQDGQILRMRDLQGHPLALTFFYARCPMPTMCPLNAASMGLLQKRLEQAGLGEKVRLVMITMDPQQDSPAKLKAWGQSLGLQFTNLQILRPNPQQANELYEDYGFAFQDMGDGIISHPTDLHLIDRQGRSARYYTGGMWDVEQVLLDLTVLEKEPAPAAATTAPAATTQP